MIDESEHFDRQDSRYVSGRIKKAEIMQGLISRIICLTHVKDGKKEADLKVHFRLGKEMSAKEWLGLGGIPAKVVEESGAGSVSDFLVGALGNCNVGADV